MGARRKLRALRHAKLAKRHAPTPALVPVVTALAAARAGYELCARRTEDTNVAVAVTSAASTISVLLEAIVRDAARYGLDVAPRSRMGDRLRWEWLASTGTVMDGGVDARILGECARVLGDVVGLDVSPLGESIASRVRLASAEAWSLASAVAAGARWRSREQAVAFL